MTQERRRRGRLAEQAVAQWLEERGWTIRAAGIRVAGVELDLIAERDDILALVEVKARSHPGLEPARLVGPRQRRRLALAARAVASRLSRDVVVRIDVAQICWQAGKPLVQLHPDAFRADEEAWG